MYFPLPFPECCMCGKKSNQSYHKDCGGELEVNPENRNVRCKKCCKNWDIMSSKYHCTCGNVFEAKEIKDALDDMIIDLTLCAEELDLLETAYWKRTHMTIDSERTFVEKFFRGLGYVAGVLFEKLVDLALRLFKLW